MDQIHEQALIKAAQRGDEKAFSELYRANVQKVYLYLFHRVSNATVAEDLTSDVFLKVLEGLPGYEPGATPFLGWVYRIAHARLVDYYRAAPQRMEHQDIDQLQIGVESDLDETLVMDYRNQHVQAAIGRLTDEQQQVIILRFIEGHNVEETARLLGKSIASIKSLQYRAVQGLAQLLKSQDFEPVE